MGSGFTRPSHHVVILANLLLFKWFLRFTNPPETLHENPERRSTHALPCTGFVLLLYPEPRTLQINNQSCNDVHRYLGIFLGNVFWWPTHQPHQPYGVLGKYFLHSCMCFFEEWIGIGPVWNVKNAQWSMGLFVSARKRSVGNHFICKGWWLLWKRLANHLQFSAVGWIASPFLKPFLAEPCENRSKMEKGETERNGKSSSAVVSRRKWRQILEDVITYVIVTIWKCKGISWHDHVCMHCARGWVGCGSLIAAIGCHWYIFLQVTTSSRWGVSYQHEFSHCWGALLTECEPAFVMEDS